MSEQETVFCRRPVLFSRFISNPRQSYLLLHPVLLRQNLSASGIPEVIVAIYSGSVWPDFEIPDRQVELRRRELRVERLLKRQQTIEAGDVNHGQPHVRIAF